MFACHLNNFDCREVRDWTCAVVLKHDVIPAHVRPAYIAPSAARVIRAAHLPATALVEHQNWRKTCRAFARVYGHCVAVWADDTATEFVLLDSGRVKECARVPAQITWDAKAA